MKVIVEVAQSIDGMIKFTYDIPENYKDGKLPVLDVTVNINNLLRLPLRKMFLFTVTLKKKLWLLSL